MSRNGFVGGSLLRPQLLIVFAMAAALAVLVIPSARVAEGADPLPNPDFPDSCGLDIVLVLDSSGSINGTELSQMQTAMKGFVAAMLPADSEFAVVDFDTTASQVGGFSDDQTTIDGWIDTPTSGGSTNWEQGLLEAYTYLPGRADGDHQNLVIFASDGNPNEVGDPPSGASEATAVDAAVVQANAIKNDFGTRIIAVGIGDGLDIANLQAISGTGADDVITSDFDTLATDLAGLIQQNCGGFLTLAKGVINDNGGDAEAGDWTLHADSTGEGLNYDTSALTDEADDDPDVLAAYTIEVEPDTYDLSESGGPDDYEASDWSCEQEVEQVDVLQLAGAASQFEQIGNSVEIGAGEHVICTITNDDPSGLICVDGHFVQPGEGLTPTNDCGPVRICLNGESMTVTEYDFRNDPNLEDATRGSCTPTEPPPELTAVPPTPVPTQEVQEIVATPTPVAEVEAVTPPNTGDGGLVGGDSAGYAPYAFGAAAIGLLGAAALVMRRKDESES